jgi:hypothetical protein
MDYEAAKRAAAVAEGLQSKSVERAEQLSEALRRTARALDWSAALAEEHAQRRELGGHTDEAAKERAMAQRASDAAQRARAQAEEFAHHH